MKIKNEELVQRMLNPQETLDTRIFDYSETMRPDIREKLLNRANFIIENTVAKIPGLEVYDICLTGSTTSYFYHKWSDIDLRIEVHHKKCPFLKKDYKTFDMFLSSLVGGVQKQGFSSFLDKRLVDIKMSSFQIDLLGLYSLKHNKWRIYPNKNIIKGITPEALLEAFKIRKDMIKAEVKKLQSQYQGQELSNKLYDCYYNQVICNTSIKDYLVFKLLNYNHVLKPIGALSIKASNEGLSL